MGEVYPRSDAALKEARAGIEPRLSSSGHTFDPTFYSLCKRRNCCSLTILCVLGAMWAHPVGSGDPPHCTPTGWE